MITRETKPHKHPHPDGVVTNYEVETIKRDGAAPIFIMRNSPDNKGYGFNSNQPLNEHLTEKHAIKAREQFKLKPSQIEWYEERKDGDYSKIKFGFTPSGANTEKHEQQWGEMSEKGGRFVVYTKEQVDKVVSDYIAQDKDVQQKFAEETDLSKHYFPERPPPPPGDSNGKQKKQEPDF
jgi:hypothetical protein